VAGDWQPLATLVRLPVLKELTCSATPELACKLSGTDLYLLDSLSGNAEFNNPVSVPDGFLGSAMPVPHPSAGTLFLKLRDDPQVVNPTSLTAQQLPVTPADSERSDSRQSALGDAVVPTATANP
jgi:hypothetical protein